MVIFVSDSKMNQLQKDALLFGIELNESQLSQFYTYYKMLIEWNEKINLTAITDFDEVLKKHFLDSIAIGRIISQGDSVSILDIGTGAGFPGIPIKIAFPNIDITLIDSLNKRVIFLNEVITALSLTKIEAIHAGLECGVFSSKIEGMDCIALGPQMFDVHTVNEKLSISSTARIFNLVVKMLEKCR